MRISADDVAAVRASVPPEVPARSPVTAATRAAPRLGSRGAIAGAVVGVALVAVATVLGVSWGSPSPDEVRPAAREPTAPPLAPAPVVEEQAAPERAATAHAAPSAASPSTLALTATLAVTTSPPGRLWVDGRDTPVAAFGVTPSRHHVVVRTPSGAEQAWDVTVTDGETLRLVRAIAP